MSDWVELSRGWSRELRLICPNVTPIATSDRHPCDHTPQFVIHFYYHHSSGSRRASSDLECIAIWD